MVFDMADEAGHRLCGRQWLRNGFLAHQRADLQQDDDDANAAHKAGDHRVGYQLDVLANAQYAKQDLEQATEYYDREGDGRTLSRVVREHAGVLDEDGRHHDRHRAGRAGDLGRRATEQGGEQTDENRAIESRDGANPGGNPHGHSQWQCNHGCGQAAVDVAADIVEMESVDQLHHEPFF
jgi:hypothetical protein